MLLFDKIIFSISPSEIELISYLQGEIKSVTFIKIFELSTLEISQLYMYVLNSCSVTMLIQVSPKSKL